MANIILTLNGLSVKYSNQLVAGSYCLHYFLHYPSCSLETTRHVSMITITLSKNELDTTSVG